MSAREESNPYAAHCNSLCDQAKAVGWLGGKKADGTERQFGALRSSGSVHQVQDGAVI